MLTFVFFTCLIYVPVGCTYFMYLYYTTQGVTKRKQSQFFIHHVQVTNWVGLLSCQHIGTLLVCNLCMVNTIRRLK